MRALIVDDSRTMRMLMKQILETAGFQVAEAVNGQEGLECLRALGPRHLALVDWNMPVMNGIEFVRAVRADPMYQDQRLIMVTTEAGEDSRKAALAVGADGYVIKPFTGQVLLENIRQLGLLPLSERPTAKRITDAMVIDDSRVTRMFLTQVLIKVGFTVTEAKSGAEALAGLKANPRPRLALVDCNMPEMDGLAVVRAIRTDPALHETRLLMVTAEEDGALIQACLAAGAEGCLHKPFTREQLLEKLTQLDIPLP